MPVDSAYAQNTHSFVSNRALCTGYGGHAALKGDVFSNEMRCKMTFHAPTIDRVATKVAVTMGLKWAPDTGPKVKISSGRSTCTDKNASDVLPVASIVITSSLYKLYYQEQEKCRAEL